MSCSGTCQARGTVLVCGGGREASAAAAATIALCALLAAVFLSHCQNVLLCCQRTALQETLFISSHDSKLSAKYEQGAVRVVCVLCVSVRPPVCLSGLPQCCRQRDVISTKPLERGRFSQAPVQFNQHYFCLNQLQLITFLLS